MSGPTNPYWGDRNKKLYDKLILPSYDVNTHFSIIRIRRIFSVQFQTVLKSIEPESNPQWVSIQIGIDRTTSWRIWNGKTLPTLNTFFMILEYIRRHLPNFNVRFLYNKDVPMLLS